MATGGGAQQSFRKALGALKDSTTVGLAKVNSEYKVLDVAIVKATYHDEFLAKEKHIRTILESLSASRPRADVAYCLQSLSRRLARTRNWAVALKSLIIIHRALREVDPTIREELMHYSQGNSHMLNLSHFKDESSHNAWDYSAWVRSYALYLEECLECLRILKYDVQTDSKRSKELDISDLLKQLPPLQLLLFRLVACQPEGAARYNYLIQFALSLVAAESIRIYVAITDGVLILVDKFFEMLRHDAVKTLEIYRKAADQAEKLSKFFEIFNGLQFGQGQKFIKIEKPPESFITSMEEYVKEAPQTLMLPWRANDDEVSATPGAFAALESDLESDRKEDVNLEEKSETSLISLETPENESNQTVTTPQIVDLLGLDELTQEPSESEDRNALALTIATPEILPSSSSSSSVALQSSSWELALVTTPSSNEAAVVQSKLAGGLDRLTLDSLYNNPLATMNQSPYGNALATTNQSPFENALALPIPNQSPFENALALPTPNQSPCCNALPTTNQDLYGNASPTANQNLYDNALPTTNQNQYNNVLPTMNQNLYDNALPTTNQNMGSYHTGEVGSNPFEIMDQTHDPFLVPSNVTSPTNVEMAEMQQQQQQQQEAFQPEYQQHPQQMVGYDPTNPFGNPFLEQGQGVSPYYPAQSQNPFSSSVKQS